MDKIIPPTYEELSSAWWAMHDCFLHYEDSSWRSYMLNKVFKELLQQCGWTVEQWNKETEIRVNNVNQTRR